MKYFIDTEFIEGRPEIPVMRWYSWNLFKKDTPPTIDLISIGIHAEDGREYYAISKDFNLKEAWNRFDMVKDDSVGAKMDGIKTPYKKVYWLRENVLLPIFFDLAQEDFHNTHFKDEWIYLEDTVTLQTFKEVWGTDLKWFKKLLDKYGKSNRRIAEEIIIHVYTVDSVPEFYGYFADYDWVVFCWLFGKMVSLPAGFPFWCIDLKQMMWERGLTKEWKQKEMPDPENEHNALADARWNYFLYKKIMFENPTIK